MKTNIYFFTGPNTLFLRRDILAWKKKFAEKYDLINVIDFSIENPEAINHIHDSLIGGFMGSKKLIIIRDILSTSKVTASIKEMQSTIYDFLMEKWGDIPDSNIICFYQSKPDKRSRFYKFLQKEAQPKFFDIPSIEERKKFISEEFPGVSNNIKNELANRFGENIELLNVEIKKLKAWKKGAQIEKNDLEYIEMESQEEIIFSIIDSILSGRTSAIEKLEKEIESSSIFQILGAITSSMRRIIYINKFHNGETKEQTSASSIGIKDFIYKKSLVPTSKIYQIEELYMQLVKLDAKSKTGMLGSDVEGALAQHTLQYIRNFLNTLCLSK